MPAFGRWYVGAQSRTSVEGFLDELTKPPVAETVEDGEIADALRANDYERALELLLARVENGADAGERDEVRRLMVALFAELGHEHPLAVRYRRRLATALY